MLQFNRFKTKIKNVSIFNKNNNNVACTNSPNNNSIGGGIVKAITRKLFNERKVVIVGEEGSFIANLLTSVLVQVECSVSLISLVLSSNNNSNNENETNNDENSSSNNSTPKSSPTIGSASVEHHDNLNSFTVNMSNCWCRSGPNMTATVDQDELSKVMTTIKDIMNNGEVVVLCCEWSEYRQLFDQLDVLSRCCKNASVGSVILVFPMGVEDDSYSQMQNTNNSSNNNLVNSNNNNSKSIESIFEGTHTTFLFYSTLMQWLFVGPPYHNINNNIRNSNSSSNGSLTGVIELLPLADSTFDDGCYWLDGDDLIKVIVDIVRQSLEKTPTHEDNRMYILTGGECISSKDIAVVLNNELQIVTQDYKGGRGDIIQKFYTYLKSPISTIQSPDIEVFLNHQPTTFIEFINKCQKNQLFTNKVEQLKRKSSVSSSSITPPSPQPSPLSNSSSATPCNNNSLNNSDNNVANINTITTSTNSLSLSANSTSSSVSTSSEKTTPGSPQSPNVSTTTTTTSTNTTTTSTTTTNSTTTTTSSITSSAIKIVSSPFSFLKYSKALIEETIYKTPAASKKSTEKDRETDVWISLLTNGFRKMLDTNTTTPPSTPPIPPSTSSPEIDNQPIIDTDYQKESIYEFLDDSQSNWTLTSYAPKVFSSIRKFYLIDNFLKTNDDNIIDFEQVKTIGRSGSFFFQSNDGRYFLKTIPNNEFLTFTKMLQSYYQHIQKYSNNLLPRFYGLYRLKGKLHIPNISSNNGCGDDSSTGSNSSNSNGGNNNNTSNSNSGETTKDRDVIFIIMENLFYSNPVVELHERYDLKGSTVGRYVDVDELEDISLHTLKDLNLKRKLYIGPYKKLLVAQLEIDTEWLLNHSICDYSLLVGIHLGSQSNLNTSSNSIQNNNQNNNNNKTKDISFFKKDFNGIISTTTKPMHVIPIRNGKTMIPPTLSRQDSVNQVRFTSMSVENGEHSADSEPSDNESSGLSEHEHEEKEEPLLKFEEGTIYFVGLIDTLTTYDMKKRGEHAIKSVLFDKTQISAVGPKDYRTRFIKYIQTIVD